jgi:hypothetical protein
MTWYVLYREAGANVMQPTEQRDVAVERACRLLASGRDVREVGPMRELAGRIDAGEIRRIWKTRVDPTKVAVTA